MKTEAVDYSKIDFDNIKDSQVFDYAVEMMKNLRELCNQISQALEHNDTTEVMRLNKELCVLLDHIERLKKRAYRMTFCDFMRSPENDKRYL